MGMPLAPIPDNSNSLIGQECGIRIPVIKYLYQNLLSDNWKYYPILMHGAFYQKEQVPSTQKSAGRFFSPPLAAAWKADPNTKPPANE
jgi:hypothetical protein